MGDLNYVNSLKVQPAYPAQQLNYAYNPNVGGG